MSTIVNRYKTVAIAHTAIVFLLNLIVLATWQFKLASIKEVFPSGQLSNPVTSICLILVAFSVYFLRSNSRKSNFTVRFIGLFIFLVGAVKISELSLGYTSGIDSWLFTEDLARYGNLGKPNFIAPNTAVCFIISGLFLLLFRLKAKRASLAEYLAFVVTIISFVSLIGYLYESMELYHVKEHIPMAFPTALSFFLLSFSILLLKSETGLLSFLTRKYDGSKTARFLIPFAILIPIVTGYLRIWGEKIGLYSPSFGIALYACCNVLIFVFLNRHTSIFLNKSNKALLSEMDERKLLEKQLLLLNKDLEMQVQRRTEELVKSQRRFRSLIENSSDIISIIDEHSQIVYVSPSVEKLIGIKPLEIIGLETGNFIHPDFEEVYRQVMEEVKKQPGVPRSTLLKVRHENGKYIWVEGVMINLIHDDDIKGIVSNFHDVSERIESEKMIMKATLQGQEKEKKQIGMELHDNINQVLASTKLYLDIAATDKNLTEQMIAKARTQLVSAINEIRSLSKTLVAPAMVKGDLTEAIKDMTGTIELSAGIKFHCCLCEQTLSGLDSDQKTAVYRIVQEQVNNIVKHAKADCVHIKFWQEEGIVVLEICDNGIGFSPDNKNSGIGLSNMKSRTELLNGQMKIHSEEEGGCRLTIKFPLEALTEAE